MSNKKPILVTIATIAILAAGGYGIYSAVSDKSTESNTSAENIDAVNNAPQDTEQRIASEQSNGQNLSDVATASGTEKQESFVIQQGNPVVAIVDGKNITRTDVYRFIQTMPQNIQQLPAATVYPMALEQVINTRLVQNKAEASDIQESEEFTRDLDMAKQQILRNIYLANAVKDVVTQNSIKKAYETYIKNIPDQEERRARHILVKTEDKANAVIEKLKTDGTSFEELAKSLSEGPSAPKGGDLGYFTQKDMVPEFANAAFELKKGDITQKPVQTQFGWHVIKLEDIRQKEKPTLAEMTPMIEADLRRKELDKKLQSWRETATIEKFNINGKPLKEGENVFGITPPQPAEEAKK